MGAGQIGGLATLLDIDFENAAGFIGEKTDYSQAQFVVYYLSHAMLFCTGALIEAHVVLTPANCVYGEKYKFQVFGGTHSFLENSGASRYVEHICTHRGYNHTMRWETCSPDNLALLLVGTQYHLNIREPDTEFVMNRVRYGVLSAQPSAVVNGNCRFYGWGSRRNGYLIPLLIHLYHVDVTILEEDECLQMWNYGHKYLCLREFPCKSEKHGALCPDDLGSVLECSGFLRGLMTSRLIDRPCGVGFLNMAKYLKFLTCGVDDSRDILGHDDFMEFEFNATTVRHYTSPSNIAHVTLKRTVTIDRDANDPGPPTARVTVSGEEVELEPPVILVENKQENDKQQKENQKKKTKTGKDSGKPNLPVDGTL